MILKINCQLLYLFHQPTNNMLEFKSFLRTNFMYESFELHEGKDEKVIV